MNIRGEMLAPAQIAALLAGEIDIALLRPPVEQAGLVVETVRRDRLLVALPEGHALEGHDELRIGDLRAEEFVVHAGRGRSVMHSVVTALAAEAGYVPRVRHEVEETSTLVTLVAAGPGWRSFPSQQRRSASPGSAIDRWYPTGSGWSWWRRMPLRRIRL